MSKSSEWVLVAAAVLLALAVPAAARGHTDKAPPVYGVQVKDLPLGYSVVLGRLPHKEGSESTKALIDGKEEADLPGLTRLINLDVYAIDPAGNKIAVENIRGPFNIEVTLPKTSDKTRLLFWDPGRGLWVPPDKSSRIRIEVISSGGAHRFRILQWPSDDEDCADG